VETNNTSYIARKPYFIKKNIIKVFPTETKFFESKEVKQREKHKRKTFKRSYSHNTLNGAKHYVMTNTSVQL